jgi:hypothetical protein
MWTWMNVKMSMDTNKKLNKNKYVNKFIFLCPRRRAVHVNVHVYVYVHVHVHVHIHVHVHRSFWCSRSWPEYEHWEVVVDSEKNVQWTLNRSNMYIIKLSPFPDMEEEFLRNKCSGWSTVLYILYYLQK